jgi:hypothetical protein
MVDELIEVEVLERSKERCQKVHHALLQSCGPSQAVGQRLDPSQRASCPQG